MAKLILEEVQLNNFTSSISALAVPYNSEALLTILLGSPSLLAILMAFERPEIKIRRILCENHDGQRGQDSQEVMILMARIQNYRVINKRM